MRLLPTAATGVCSSRLALLAVLALLPVGLAAQTAPAAGGSGKSDDVIQLNPFEVKTDKDTSYGALNSTSVTKFNVELSKVPITADVFTQDFMNDVDATDINSMLLQYGAGMGQSFMDAAGNANNTQPGDRATDGDRFASPRLGSRGLPASYIRRDGFDVAATSTNGTSNFDVERVEVLKGPQGLLYGAGGPGGTIVVTSKQARFSSSTRTPRTSGQAQFRIDQYGGKRSLFDANVGTKNVAVRMVVLRQDDRQRRLFIGGLTQGYYGQVAVKLPFNSILRLEDEYTYSKRTTPNNISVNTGALDPRNGESLAYLLATNQTGATNPDPTGKPFTAGAIDNGHLDWFDYASFGGWRGEDRHSNHIVQATIESVWSSWFSTRIGYNWNKDMEVLNDSTISQLTAPGVSGNPTGDWAVSSNMFTTHRPQLHRSLQASGLLSNHLFSGHVTSQSAFGYDHEWIGSSPDDFGYFLSDANGAVTYDPTIRTNLGRTPMPVQWWSVGNGPLMHPFVPIETPTYLAQDGKHYSLIEKNPINPAWITPTNPWGNAAGQFPGTGISGINNGPWGFIQQRIDAFYATNYTQWYRDWIDTLVGFRHSHTANPVASGGNLTGSSYSNNSYNLGLDGRITNNLRWYAALSSTYDNPFGFSDPMGVPPPTSSAVGREAGLKFNFLDNRISGSVSYYRTNAKDENVAYGFGIVNNINPNGLNGIYKGQVGRNGFIPLDYTADGEELMVTAAPTSHWRIRLSAAISNGRVGTNKVYPIVYNDQFYVNGKAGGKGAVTYNDGSPFLVPTDPTKIKAVAGLRGQTNPSTLLGSTPTVQLTTDMMSTPGSPYYAWSSSTQDPANAAHWLPNAITAAGNIDPNSPVGKALQYFNKPGVGTALTGALDLPFADMQYTWPDPANTHGAFTVAKAGEKTVGYPAYAVSLTNAYEFSQGWLRGVGIVVSLNDSWQYRSYYYNTPDGSRVLFSQPSLGWIVNVNPYYQRKIFGRFMWRTQLNIANLFNHYLVVQTPNNGLGFTRPSSIGVAWYGQPRAISWTNTISF
ncbi:MAG TPA: TonB-dependent receptor plug domain-containing protein [Opitutaceae bacterium]|nr:TonB-dependent receptor plug domain-containing protein [Opitutaceae bacterium]